MELTVEVIKNMENKKLIKKAKMPKPGEKLKAKFDDWLNENINVPAAKAGHEDIGAGLSAALSSGAELIVPDDLADVAMSAIPGAKLFKIGKKGFKQLKKADKAIPEKAIDKVEMPKAKPHIPGHTKPKKSYKEHVAPPSAVVYKKKPKPKTEEAPVMDYGKIKEEIKEKVAKNKGSHFRYGPRGTVTEVK